MGHLPNLKQQVPFDSAQGRLSTPQIIALAIICSGRDDRVEEIWTSLLKLKAGPSTGSGQAFSQKPRRTGHTTDLAGATLRQQGTS